MERDERDDVARAPNVIGPHVADPRALELRAVMGDAYDRRPAFGARLGNRLKGTTKAQAKSVVWLAMAALGLLTRSHAPSPPPQAGDRRVRRILVVRVDLLGDVVLSLPAVRALRRAFPDAELDMLVLNSTAPILASERDITHALAYDPHVWRRPASLVSGRAWREAVALLRRLRAAEYDLAVSVSGDIGSILTRLSGARWRFGYAAEAYPFLLTHTLPGGRYLAHQHEVEYVLALARAAGGVVEPEDALLRLRVAPEAERRARELIRQGRRATGAEGPVIVLHGGARNGQAKRWPATHFAALADRLREELDALIILSGAPNEASIAREIADGCTRAPFNLVGKTSIPQLVALLAAGDLLITGDSGPMHIACAVRTPVVALHGPTDPALSGPTAPDAIVLRQDLWCSPCYDASATAECPFGNPVCMKAIPPEAVVLAARRQLRRARGARERAALPLRAPAASSADAAQ